MDLAMPTYMPTGAKRKEALPGGATKTLKSRGGASASASNSADRGYDALLLATAELSLEAKAESREVAGYMQYAILAPSQTPLALDTLAEAKEYGELVQKHKGEDTGPAHVRIALKGFQALMGMKDFAEDEDFRRRWMRSGQRRWQG